MVLKLQKNQAVIKSAALAADLITAWIFCIFLARPKNSKKKKVVPFELEELSQETVMLHLRKFVADGAAMTKIVQEISQKGHKNLIIDNKKIENLFFKNLKKIGYNYFSVYKRSIKDKKIIKSFQQHYLPNNVTGKIDQKTYKISHFLTN